MELTAMRAISQPAFSSLLLPEGGNPVAGVGIGHGLDCNRIASADFNITYLNFLCKVSGCH